MLTPGSGLTFLKLEPRAATFFGFAEALRFFSVYHKVLVVPTNSPNRQ
jgi:hypothetical protein